MSSIIIESSPISSNGICYSNSGQSIIFNIVSGITSSTVYCEWFLNGKSVYFGSSYILLTPNTNDEVYARVVNCSGETLRIGNWIEDNIFYFNDVPSGVHTYYIDLKASFNYKILSSVFKSSNNGVVQIQIDGTPIIWSGSGNTINISNSIIDTEAIGSNYVTIGQKVTLITNGTNVISGKIRFIRVMKNDRVPLPSTTTTTTSTSTTSTTSTTSNCVQISETLKYSIYSAIDACSQISTSTYYGNNSSFALTTTISASPACLVKLGGWYSNGVIWKYTSDGTNFTLSGTCSSVTTTTTTAAPVYYGYKVNVYNCGSCTLVQSNLIVQDTNEFLLINRFYNDSITGYVYKIVDNNQIIGGQTSNMIGTGKSSCALVSPCI